MSEHSSRRQWLRNTATAIAGMSIAPSLLATQREKYRAAGIILLNSNENAYGPCVAAKEAMRNALVNSNRYPDDLVPLLKKQVADFWEVKSENILMGAGGSELLATMNLYSCVNKGKMVTAHPSFNSWTRQAGALGMQVVQIPLAADKKLDLPAMLSAIDSETRMVYVCNPNNPSGTIIENTTLRNFVTECSKKCTVLVDEAYTEYDNIPSLKDMAVQNKSIVVVKTFSKIYGLAGARIGYAIGHSDTISRMSIFQLWPEVSVSMATAAAAMASLKEQAFAKDCKEKTAQARQMCYDVFKNLSLDYVPSHTSFILFDVTKIHAAYMKKMQENNIMVQYRDFFGGKWSRVSMGTIEEMQAFCSALKSTVG
jgi:histidinol-phosphate aminotransferase